MKNFLKEENVVLIVSNHWKYIVFVVILSIVIVYNSHNTDKKIIELADLKENLKEVNSEYVDTRTKLMELKNEEYIINKVKAIGLYPLKFPPKKIVLDTTDTN